MATRSSFDENIFWVPDDALSPLIQAKLRVAGESLLNYARFMSQRELRDEDAFGELLERALHLAGQALARKQELPSDEEIQKLVRDQVLQLVKQSARRKRRELPKGSLFDLETFSFKQASHLDQEILCSEFFDLLSPYARSIAQLRRAGYTWREIGAQFGLAHSGIRRAFQQEADPALVKLKERYRQKSAGG